MENTTYALVLRVRVHMHMIEFSLLALHIYIHDMSAACQSVGAPLWSRLKDFNNYQIECFCTEINSPCRMNRTDYGNPVGHLTCEMYQIDQNVTFMSSRG